MSILNTNTTSRLNGEYYIVFNNTKNIILGPDQCYGSISTPYNVFFDPSLEVVNQYIIDNYLIIPNNDGVS